MMAAMDFNQLSGSLKTGLRPIYVIHGEEELLKIEALDKIRAASKSRGYLKKRNLIGKNCGRKLPVPVYLAIVNC